MRSPQRSSRAPILSERSVTGSLAAGLVVALCASPAQALQPLGEFFASSRKMSTDARQAALTTVQREADALVAEGQLLPSLSASGTYTFNQYEAAVAGEGTLVIQPRHGLSGTAQLSVPLLDLAGWRRLQAARTLVEAARQSAETTALAVERQVAQSYFQLIGAEALCRSYDQSLAVARESVATAVAKREEGAATDLDVSRAEVDVEGLNLKLADERLVVALAHRALRTLSGLEPAADPPELSDDLHDEGPLQSWESRAEQVPSVKVATESALAAAQQEQADRLAFLPSVNGAATEQATNAPGFVGHSAYFTATVSASWRLDVSAFGRVKGRDAAAASARVQQQAALDRARDAVHEAWQRVASGIAASRAARSQAASARLAARSARERYAGGSGTQLELSQAQRDQSSMEAARIQADANLLLARALLRLTVGEH